ncbi:MAG: hypothetical protein ACLQVD_02760, partial [Capsulimonadaceae bacterium]
IGPPVDDAWPLAGDLLKERSQSMESQPLRYLASAVLFAVLVALNVQSAQHPSFLWFYGYPALVCAGILAVAMAACLCAIVSPTLRASVDNAWRWLRAPSAAAPAIPVWAPPIVFVCVAFLLYYRTLTIGFLADDWGYLQLADRNRIEATNFWRPCVNAGFWIDDRLWRHNPLPWHIENVAIYGLTAYVIYLLTRRMATGIRSSELAGWSAATIFLLMPGHNETVNWLCDRSDLSGAFFSLCGLLAYLRYRDDGRVATFMLSSVLLTLGLLSKEAMVLMPVGVCIAEVARRKWVNAAVLALVEAAYLVIRSMVIGKIVGGYTDSVLVGHDLNVSFLWHIVCEFPDPAGLLIAVSVISYLAVRRPVRMVTVAGLLICLAFYVAALLPVLSTSPGPEGNRYIFLPSAFSTILIGLSVACATQDRRRISYALVVPIVAGMIAPFPEHVRIENKDWIAAGRFVRASITRARAAGSRTILDADRTDHIGRAYVWRNNSDTAVGLGEQ